MSFVRVYFFHLRLCAFVSFFLIFCFLLIHCNYENVFCFSYILLSTSTKILFTQIESNLAVRCGVTDTGAVSPESLLESDCELWLTKYGRRGERRIRRRRKQWKCPCGKSPASPINQTGCLGLRQVQIWIFLILPINLIKLNA